MEPSISTSRHFDKKKRARSTAVKEDEAEPSAEAIGADDHSGHKAARSSSSPVSTRQRSNSSEQPAKRSKKRKTQAVIPEDAGVIDLSPDPAPVTRSTIGGVDVNAIAGPSSPSPSTSAQAQKDLAADEDKGKAKEQLAVGPSNVTAGLIASMDPTDLQNEVERLKKELATKNELIDSQRSTISHMYHQCTCSICLELVWRPFILAPCGHTFCVVCLMSWFKKPLEKEGDMPPHLNDVERASEAQRRTLRRKKTCPACRTELACAPVEIWLVKGMLEKLEVAARAVGTSDSGLLDDTVSAIEIAKARGEDLPAGAKLWEDVFDGRGPRRVLYDDSDGVRRCGQCASEIWDGICSNPECGIEYSDLSDDEYGSDLLPSDNLYGQLAGANGRRARAPRSDGGDDDSRSEDTHFSDSEDDMRSFIEDDMADDEEPRHGRPRQEYYVDDGDDGFIAGPRRIVDQNANSPIEISDDDDDSFIRDDDEESFDDAEDRQGEVRLRRDSTMTPSDDDEGPERRAGRLRRRGLESDGDGSSGQSDNEDNMIADSSGQDDEDRGEGRVRAAAGSRRRGGGRIVDSDDDEGRATGDDDDDDVSMRSDNNSNSDHDSNVGSGAREEEAGGYETADDTPSGDEGGRPLRSGGSRRVIADSDED